MRKEYDFSKARKNPYASMLKKPITIRLDEDSVSYFKAVSQEVGIPYQSLINQLLYHSIKQFPALSFDKIPISAKSNRTHTNFHNHYV